MVKRKPQIIRRLSAAVMSLSLLLGITSCDVLIEEIVEAYYSNETGDIEAVRETEVTFESFEPTGSFTSDTPETTELTVNFVKSSYVYSVWYDVTSDNPADYSSITSDKAYALKGVFYFSSPLTGTFEAKILKDDEVVLTRNVNMYDNVTAEADFSAGLEGLGTFEPGDYTVELYFNGEFVAKTGGMRVK